MSEYMTDEEIIELRKTHLLPSTITYYSKPVHLVRGEMQYVWDAQGRRYLDAFGGIVTISAGHCHPYVTAKTVEQTQKLQHTTCIYLTEPVVRLARKLSELAPHGLRKCFFGSSGSEANEAAILLARMWTRRFTVVALRHSYHGCSTTAMALTGQSAWRHASFNTLGIIHAAQPNCYRCPFRATYPSCDLLCAKDIEDLIRCSTTGEIAAFIAEPVQGVGGFVVPPAGYFEEAVGIARKYGAAFISDEVQTGVGRTGKHWFGIQHWNVKPDMMTMAKGFGNGAPVGAVMTTDEVADSMKGKLHITTFGGDPPAMAQALATIEVLEKENVPAKADEIGRRIFDGLKDVAGRRPLVGDVRGMGLMIGVELVKDRTTKEPAPQEALKVMEACKDNGLLVGRGSLYGNVLRISPPMCITTGDADKIVEIMDRSLV